MSQRDYAIAQKIDQQADWSEDFYALVMVLMMNADTTNQAYLRGAWPLIWEEVQARYNAPKALLVGEEDHDGWKRTEEGLFDPDGKLVRAV